ncbi:MAG: helix-turn-helix domain-containing protein [Bacteroidia bacterium]
MFIDLVLTILISINTFLFGFLAAFLLLRKIGPLMARYLLVSFFLSWVAILLEAMGLIGGFLQSYPRLAFWGSSLIWIQGPLIYLFTRSLTNPQQAWKNRDWLHFLPGLLVLLLTQIGFQNLTPERQLYVIEASQTSGAVPVILGTLVFFGYVSVYLWQSWRLTQRYQRLLKNEYATIEGKSLRWLYLMIGSFSLVLLIAALQNAARFYFPHVLTFAQILVFLAVLLFATRLVLQFMDHQPLAFLAELPDSAMIAVDREPEKQSLMHFMASHAPFLDPDLSLAGLAERLDTEPRTLSQLINQGFEQSFFDFINSQRIDYACKRLRSTTAKERNVTEIMYESGFNSKSSFNTAFKKYTQMTPSQYRKNN